MTATAIITPTARTGRKAARMVREAAITKAIEAFTVSGSTHDGSLESTSTRAIPEGDEIRIRSADGVTELVRVMASGQIALAGTKATNGNELAETWLGGYRNASMRERCTRFLQCDDPGDLLAQQEATLKANGQLPTNGTYKAKSVMTVVSASVSKGGTDKVKRVTWNGHSGFSFARYLGSIGLTGSQGVQVFAKLGIEFGKSAIIGGVYAGKKGERGAPAQLTPVQAQQVQDIMAELAATDEAKAKPAPKVEEVIRPATKVAQPAAPPAKLTKAEKRRAHDDVVTAAVKARKAAGKK